MQGSTVTRPRQVMFQGKPVEMVTLKNTNGMEVQAISYGAIITSLKVPDRAGTLADVVLGFDQPDRYLAEPPPPYFGAIVGRYGNRIAKGAVHARRQDVHAGEEQRPESSARRHQGLRQGGVERGDEATRRRAPSAIFTRTSPDGEEGYPGNLHVARDLHAHRQERADRRLPRDDRQGRRRST